MERVDAQIEKITSEQYALAKKLISENQDIMHAMAAALLHYETLDAEQVSDIMARKPVQAAKLINNNEDKEKDQNQGNPTPPAAATTTPSPAAPTASTAPTETAGTDKTPPPTA
jgi:cell division protease FtsH